MEKLIPENDKLYRVAVRRENITVEEERFTGRCYFSRKNMRVLLIVIPLYLLTDGYPVDLLATSREDIFLLQLLSCQSSPHFAEVLYRLE